MTEEMLFAAALEKTTPDGRSAFLDDACSGDAALRKRVEALLQSHGHADFLKAPAVNRPVEALAGQACAGDTQAELPAGDGDVEALDFLAPSDKPDAIGRLSHYEVLEVIGRGGMGIVLRAFDEKLHRVVAIKVMAGQLAINANARKRFTREAQAAAAVTHDHLVTIHAVEEGNGLPYLVMQFVSGMSLQQRLDRDGPLQLTEIVRIGLQTAAGLAAAHAHGLIHRDIKPANILLENGVERVKITDFGLARAVADASLTQSGVVAGTPQYMSPEQARGETVDQRSDLFSLGSVLYAMCTGRPPFRSNSSVAVLKRVCDETPSAIRETNPEIPDWLVAIVTKLHAKNPAERFQSAAEVADLLKDHLAHLQHPSVVGPVASNLTVPFVRPSGRDAAVGQPDRRRRRWALSAAALLLCVVAGLGITEATDVTHLRATAIRIFAPEGALVVEVDDSGVKAGATGQKESLAPGEVRRFEGHTHPVNGVAFSSDGRHVVTASGNSTQPDPPGERDDTVRLWDVKTGKELRRFVGHGREVVGVAISRDGRRILSGAYDNTVRLWDAQTGQELRQFTGHTAGVRTVAFSPDVRYAASAGGINHEGKVLDCDVHLWELESGKDLRRFKGHTHLIANLAFSPDGRHLLTGSLDNSMRLWEVESGKEVRRFAGHTNWVLGVAISRDGRHAFSASFDATVRVWEVATGKEVKCFAVPQRVLSVACSPDGRRVLAGTMEGVMHLWDLQTGKELRRYEGKFVAISPDGRQAASASAAGAVRLWDLPDQFAETQAFALLGGNGVEVRKYDTLAEAVQGASAGDTIEIRGNGPFVSAPINLGNQALTIRAGEGFRPVVRLGSEGKQAELSLLMAYGPLVLEGIEWQHPGGPHDNPRMESIVWTRGPALHIANCRFVMAPGAGQRCVYSEAPVVSFRNCEFLSHGRGVWGLQPNNQVQVLDNCLHLGHSSLQNGYAGSHSATASIRLTRNTFVTDQVAVGIEVYVLPEPSGTAPSPIQMDVSSTIFDGPSALCVTMPGKVLSQETLVKPGYVEGHLRRMLVWRDQENLYAGTGPALLFWALERVNSAPGVPRSLAEWKRFWGSSDAACAEGRVRYEGGNLFARFAESPDQLRPADFRLRPDSAGYKAGKDGKDLGANVDLVGPGPAYERWKKTPEYQQWIKDTQQVTKAAEPKAFVLLSAKDVAERKFDTLADAVQGASAGDAIEIRGNGPFVTKPIKINTALTIRAGDGFRPVINLTVAPITQTEPHYQIGLETVAPLVLEGLEFRLLVPYQGKIYHSAVMAATALRIDNCRFLTTNATCFRSHVEIFSPLSIWEVRNCEFLSSGDNVALLEFPTAHRLILENCVATAACAVFCGVSESKEPSLQLTHNTFRCRVQAVGLGEYDRGQDFEDAKQKGNALLFKAVGNVFDSDRYFSAYSPPGKFRSPADAERRLAQVVGWKGERNLYSVAGQFLTLWTPEKGFYDLATPVKSLSNWRQFWGTDEADSTFTASVRYQGGDILARLDLAPEKLTPEDFRLRPDSAGYKAGKDGKDLGANVDLVGPGPAYERWKKTPEYQQWLKETKQVTKAEGSTAESKAFVVLTGKGVEVRRYDTLAEAVRGAIDGDTIEIRGNGPYVTEPINIKNQSLIIRAADGYRPVLKQTAEAVEKCLPLLETSAPLVLEGLELQQVSQTIRAGSSHSMLTSNEAPLWLANCRFFMKDQQQLWLRAVYCPTVELHNCEFFTNGEGLHLLVDKSSKCLVSNCVQAGGMMLGLSSDRSGAREALVRLERNTLATSTWGLVRLTVGGGSSPKHWGLSPEHKLVRIKAADNILDANSALTFCQYPETPSQEQWSAIKGQEAETAFRTMIQWDDGRNVFAPGASSIDWLISGGFDAPHGPKSLASWKKFWGNPNADALEGQVRYQGGNLSALLAAGPDKLTAEHFRLRPDSAGYRAGKDGKDLGANIDLVGPGPAYERWKKTPAYQQWLKDSGQVKK